MCSADIFLGVLAILFPPLPVWVKRGICSADSLINILLCLLGFIPGMLHAWYIIAKFPEPPYEYENGFDGWTTQ
ncbi:Plasma membrane proteolipid 3 [Beauveria bassiana]|uniref:Plasma membrane proteolipid 3 n=1 Tax=Beauveria bassiana TaxID=176275 RepID=A0A2N6P2G0_BEABA|nr:Plasma membrane proteolipid 3 [Beauveria bassiana]